VNHGSLCACTACILARAYDGFTPESDAQAQVDMVLARRRREDGIASILADTAGPTNHDRDAR
jgi:hypothetical protein